MSKSRSEEKFNKLINSTKGKYITQGVSFNKECERQMGLLKYALEESASFSGLVKEMLAQRKDNVGKVINTNNSNNNITSNNRRKVIDKKKIKNDWL